MAAVTQQQQCLAFIPLQRHQDGWQLNTPRGGAGQTAGVAPGDEIADLRRWLDTEVRQRLLALEAQLSRLNRRLDDTVPNCNDVTWWHPKAVNGHGMINGNGKYPSETPLKDPMIDPDLMEPILDERPAGWSELCIPPTPVKEPEEPVPPRPTLRKNVPSQVTQASGMSLEGGIDSSSSTSHIHGDLGCPNDNLEKAVREGELKDVQRALAANADPNVHFGTYKLKEANFKEFSEGTPLAVAVLRCKKDIIRTLVEHRADPDSKYAFKAGAVRMNCQLPASHATVALGDLSILEMLVEARADLTATGTNQANLVWQAAYFGQVEFTKYLLSKKVRPDEPAISQDNNNDRHTPLHAAARQGHAKVVSMLLDSQVWVSGKDQYTTPLEDAIVLGHGEVVRILIARGAKLFSATKFSHEYMYHGGLWSERPSQSDNGTVQEYSSTCAETPLNVLFGKGNSVVIAKAALGLRQAPEKELDKLNADSLLSFLKTPGKAPVEILRSIVRRHTIRYWDIDKKGLKKRRELKTSLMDSARGFNVSEGPHANILTKFYNQQMPVKEDPLRLARTFLDELAPQPRKEDKDAWQPERNWLRRSREPPAQAHAFVDVDLLMVHVVGVSGNMEVLWALADQTDTEVFAETGCRAIVHLHWTKVSKSVHLLIAYELIYLVLFCTLIVLIRELKDGDRSAQVGLFIVTSLCCLADGWEVMFFIAHILGCNLCGLWTRPLNFWNGFEVVKFVATTALLVRILIDGLEVQEDTIFKTILGCLVFLRWMKALESFRALQSIGLRILPIMSTMWEVGPFVGVLLMYLFGCVSAYYALGLKGAFDSFTLIFRVVIMGEVEMDELEGINGRLESAKHTNQTSGHPSVYHMADPDSTSYYLPVRLLLIATSFFIGLALTNVFIAVLCISYEKASLQATSGFTRALANIVIDHHTRMVGLRRVLCCETPKKKSWPRRPTASLETQEAMFRTHRITTYHGNSGASGLNNNPGVSNTSLPADGEPQEEVDWAGYIWYSVPHKED